MAPTRGMTQASSRLETSSNTAGIDMLISCSRPKNVFDFLKMEREFY